MVRLERGQPRPSSTTRRVDLPDRRPARRAPDATGAVLRAVLDHGPVARSNLARLTGTSAATVTGVTSTLLDLGLLREVPEAAGPPGFGRPHVPLDLDTEGVAVLGVHVAVPQVAVSVLDARGRVLDCRRLPYDRPTPAEVVALAGEEIARLVEQYADRSILGVGVAAGGWVDARAGVVVDHPVLGWRDAPLREPLGELTGLPTYVENHGRALLRAEQLFGAHVARARESIVHLFVGNVVDAAFSIRGRVHQGARSASGTVAHLPVDVDPGEAEPCRCGRVGCLQAAVSERTLLRAADRLGVSAPSAAVLCDLALAGDERLAELFVRRARLVGHAAASLLDLVNPEVLVVMESGIRRLPAARAALLEEVALRSEIAGDVAGIIAPTSFTDPLAVAGGAVALDRLFAAPLASVGALSTAS